MVLSTLLATAFVAVAYAPTAAAALPQCVDTTPPGASDFGTVYCYDLKGPCYVTATTTYIWGQETTCVIGAGAGTQGVECMERYSREDVGPVTVVSRNSCSYEVYYQGEPILQ